MKTNVLQSKTTNNQFIGYFKPINFYFIHFFIRNCLIIAPRKYFFLVKTNLHFYNLLHLQSIFNPQDRLTFLMQRLKLKQSLVDVVLSFSSSTHRTITWRSVTDMLVLNAIVTVNYMIKAENKLYNELSQLKTK